jgi:hypothetical protein
VRRQGRGPRFNYQSKDPAACVWSSSTAFTAVVGVSARTTIRAIAFFDPLPEGPPRPPDPPRQKPPPWAAPPEDVLPGIVALELPLVHDDRRVMWIAAAEVYPEGMTFTLLMRGRQEARQGIETGPGTWRFGVQFSDGRKATAHGIFSGTNMAGPAPPGVVRIIGGGTSGPAPGPRGSQPPPDRPILRTKWRRGSRSEWRQQYWLWPLPPPGELLLACEWPDVELELTTATIDTAVLLDAATRAKPLWPNQDPPRPGASQL